MTEFGQRTRKLLQRSKGALEPKKAEPADFLSFFRTVEKLTLDRKLKPVISYWSSSKVARLLPSGDDYGALVRESTSVNHVAEEHGAVRDEWCFLVVSTQLCVAVYGQNGEKDNGTIYECTASEEPLIVQECFTNLQKHLHKTNAEEAERLGDSIKLLGTCRSVPANIEIIEKAWKS